MSPIRGSLAAGSSRGFGDSRFVKSVSEVTAQRKEGRYTTSITTPGTNVTLNQTPVAGNLLVITVSSNNALASATITYGGTTATLVNGYFGTGVCCYMFYVLLTTANVASGGTTVNIVWSAGTAAGYSVTELVGVSTASPVDISTVTVGTISNAGLLTTPNASVGHTTLGCYGIYAATVAGAQTYNAGSLTIRQTDMTQFGGVWGSFTASCDIATTAWSSPTVSTILNMSLPYSGSGATSRVAVGIYAAFRAAA
jgi:hypothetical protein